MLSMVLDTKELADGAVLAVAALYAVSLIFRARTRYKARVWECVVVFCLLLALLVLLPIVFGVA